MHGGLCARNNNKHCLARGMSHLVCILCIVVVVVVVVAWQLEESCGFGCYYHGGAGGGIVVFSQFC